MLDVEHVVLDVHERVVLIENRQGLGGRLRPHDGASRDVASVRAGVVGGAGLRARARSRELDEDAGGEADHEDDGGR